ncbi:MAG: OPT/YSL family transporter, partial [Bacteroidetes bacterium]|nr:OPT/YSL family transporter [Bacteroidota bacterium]
LMSGITRSFSYLKQSASGGAEILRTDKDISLRRGLPVFGVILVVMFFIFQYFSGAAMPAGVASVVMMVLGFVFAAVSGYLVGIIGVSNNPTSGLTVSVLIVVAFLMLALGMSGEPAVAAVLGVAAFTCTSVSVAGEMMQDLKAGHILGCTPWKMQVGDMLGVTAAAVVMFLVLSLLHLGDLKRAVGNELDKLEQSGATAVTYRGEQAELQGKSYTLAEVKLLSPEEQNDILGTQAGFGGEKLPAPQASLMAVVTRGIVEAQAELILILVGVFFGLALILMQVKSPMLISVGMYLPIDTTFAIFVGGLMKGALDKMLAKKKIEGAAKEKIDNVGVLLASGMIAGEALLGLLFAGLAFAEIKIFHVFEEPTYLLSLAAIAVIALILVRVPWAEAKKSLS